MEKSIVNSFNWLSYLQIYCPDGALVLFKIMYIEALSSLSTESLEIQPRICSVVCALQWIELLHSLVNLAWMRMILVLVSSRAAIRWQSSDRNKACLSGEKFCGLGRHVHCVSLAEVYQRPVAHESCSALEILNSKDTKAFSGCCLDLVELCWG